jgi:hypothetical protein
MQLVGHNILQLKLYNIFIVIALATLPKDKTSPHLSPDDQVSKLFEHESIISQSRKEPIFRVHYALQVCIHINQFRD